MMWLKRVPSARRGVKDGRGRLIAGESTTALDVTTQAQILNLLLELQETMGLTYTFVVNRPVGELPPGRGAGT